MKNNILNIIFICLFFTIIFILFIKIPFQQQNIIEKENRKANKIGIETLLNKNYSINLELALSDQITLSDNLKQIPYTYNNFIFNKINKLNKETGYKLVTNKHYNFNNSDYLLDKRYTKEDLDSIDFNGFSKNYNEINLKSKYLYYIPTEEVLDFENSSNNLDIYSKIKESFNTFKTDYLKVITVSNYENYFYKTDHHLNYKGSYEGYKDILKLINNLEKPLSPVETKEFNVPFYGSKARLSQFYDYKENFTTYLFNIKEHKTIVNGIEMPIGNKELYLNNGNIDDYANHYGIYYGFDYKEIIYDFNNNKDNLLIIGSSYMAPINELLASHFNKTHFINLKLYKNFNINEYIKDNNIDTFLFVAQSDPDLFFEELDDWRLE